MSPHTWHDTGIRRKKIKPKFRSPGKTLSVYRCSVCEIELEVYDDELVIEALARTTRESDCDLEVINQVMRV